MLDRFHGFIEGWYLPRMREELKINGYGLNVEYFSEIAMIKVFNGSWKWKEETKLTTLLCNCAKSEIAHWVRKWRSMQAKGHIEPPPVSSLYDPDKAIDELGYDPEKEDELSEDEREAADENAENEPAPVIDSSEGKENAGEMIDPGDSEIPGMVEQWEIIDRWQHMLDVA